MLSSKFGSSKNLLAVISRPRQMVSMVLRSIELFFAVMIPVI